MYVVKFLLYFYLDIRLGRLDLGLIPIVLSDCSLMVCRMTLKGCLFMYSFINSYDASKSKARIVCVLWVRTRDLGLLVETVDDIA